jgi:hypothetical protein
MHQRCHEPLRGQARPAEGVNWMGAQLPGQVALVPRTGDAGLHKFVLCPGGCSPL